LQFSFIRQVAAQRDYHHEISCWI